MRLRLRWFAVGAGALAVLAAVYVLFHPYLLLVFSTEPLKPPTPPLLEGGGGELVARTHDSGCPPWDPSDRKNPGSIEDRLATAFPAGTPQDQLVRSLARQGFTVEPSCAVDPTIRSATFRQSGGGFYGPYPAFSMVTWKVDTAGRIIWASGWVAYTGP